MVEEPFDASGGAAGAAGVPGLPEGAVVGLADAAPAGLGDCDDLLSDTAAFVLAGAVCWAALDAGATAVEPAGDEGTGCADVLRAVTSDCSFCLAGAVSPGSDADTVFLIEEGVGVASGTGVIFFSG